MDSFGPVEGELEGEILESTDSQAVGIEMSNCIRQLLTGVTTLLATTCWDEGEQPINGKIIM